MQWVLNEMIKRLVNNKTVIKNRLLQTDIFDVFLTVNNPSINEWVEQEDSWSFSSIPKFEHLPKFEFKSGDEQMLKEIEGKYLN